MIVHLLGTGAAVSDPHRTTTMLAVEAADRLVLVDCGGDAIQRMLASGLSPLGLDAVVLTHQHPDHISGFGLLVEKLWLLGREEAIPVYGPADALRVARQTFALYDTGKWKDLPAIDWHPIEMEPSSHVLTLSDLTITSWPVVHPVPTIGLRFVMPDAVLGYSCDTSPTPSVLDLARDADLLVHEATGHLPGVHSSAEEAAQAARSAGARDLVLVHLPPDTADDDLADARAIFKPTRWSVEGERLTVRSVARGVATR